jgi:4-hydroxy-2-oxoheptanedioate aldolase
MDASGIMVPHIMNLEDAKNVVKMTRFHPIGRRPLDGGNADGLYAAIETTEYMKQANEQRFVIFQIEDPEPLNELEQIAAIPGYDMLFFGPGDFSQGIGVPCQWDNPTIKETRIKIAEVCRKHNKFAGTVGSLSNLDELIKMGYQFVSIGADVVGLGNYCRQIVEGFTKNKSVQTGGIYSDK